MALKKFAVAPGLRVDLWAEEPLIENVVAFAFDEKGRAFVVETHRRRTSVPDIRKNMDWLFDSLAMRTVEDRVAFLHKALDPELKLKPTKDHADINGDGQFDWRDWAVESEDIKLVEDRNDAGKADTARSSPTDFHSLETGTAAGVAVRGDDVWFACIPDLWHFRGAREGKATTRDQLLTGFGVHIAYGGHDMHGTKIGPDGRLYWTIADYRRARDDEGGQGDRQSRQRRGFPLRSRWLEHGTLRHRPAQSAVARLQRSRRSFHRRQQCRRRRQGALDARRRRRRLRLAHRLAISAQARPVEFRGHVASRQQSHQSRAAAAGGPHRPRPGGHRALSRHGLARRYADHFFYADFPGGVRSFALKPKGASYTVDNPGDVLQDNKPGQMTGKLLWDLYPSDVQFSTNGGVYVLDWVFGWEKTGKGRIYPRARSRRWMPARWCRKRRSCSPRAWASSAPRN